jgi:uncharacterized pyridoxamine 5'-phosphate oxidase family protein
MPAPKPEKKMAGPRASRPHMPGYGLPKGNKNLLPWNWAEQRLKQSHNFWISTTRPDGTPHTMVVWGLWLDGAFYFSTGRRSRKSKNLTANPKCVICTEKADEAVILEGSAEEVAERAQIARVLRKYERKYNFDMASFEQDMYQHKEPLYCVRPRIVFGLSERASLKKATRWQFA